MATRLAIVIVLAFATGLSAQPMELLGGPGLGAEPFLSVEAVASHTRVAPGQRFHVALVLTPKAGWSYYSPDPGTSGDFTPLAASIEAKVGAWKASEALWPMDAAHEYDLAGAKYVNNAYVGRTVVYVPITVPADARPGAVTLSFHPRGQVCGDQCVNLDGLNEVTGRVEVTVAAEAVAHAKWAPLQAGLSEVVTVAELTRRHRVGQAVAVDGLAPAGAHMSVVAGLALALLAGLILNVMPCVLPVIPIRILSIVGLAQESRRRFVTLGLAFAGGIVLFFVALAVISAGVRLATGNALDWGKHFQLAPLRVTMALVMVALAANLLGAFNVVVPSKVAGLAPGAEAGRGGREHLASCGMGLMMAVLSTPCSFAILAVAFAWAQTQPLWLGSLAITLIGVGMAAPHAVLTALPGLVEKLPRPGIWMEHLKKSMGFILLLVAVWLIGTLCPDTYAGWVSGYAVVLAFALWVWGSWVRYDAPRARKLAIRGSAVALAVLAGYWMLRPSQPAAVALEPFDEARIASARKAGRVVVVKFTASWCLSCRVVDATIYNDKEVADRFAADGVLAVKGDVTRAELPANDMLYRRFRGAPPLSVVFPPRGEPLFLVGKFSKGELFAALDKAKGS